MKKILFILPVLAVALFCGCSGREVSTDYNGELCENLAMRIESRDSLPQLDYAEMIGQNEAILKYLIEQAERLSEEPDSLRNGEWRLLTADPVYMERFGYMFTLGSALYSARLEGLLDEENIDAYDALDKYNERLADYADRN